VRAHRLPFNTAASLSGVGIGLGGGVGLTAGILFGGAESMLTTTQFPSVKRTVYSFDGSRHAFYGWLQREAPELQR
jgi:hypothetical protein